MPQLVCQAHYASYMRDVKGSRDPILAIHIDLYARFASSGIHSRSRPGVKCLTLTAQFTLHSIFARLLVSSPQRVHQIHQAEQVLDPEESTPSRPIQERVHRRQARPSQGQSPCSVIPLGPKMNPVAIPTSEHLNDLELPAMQRVKRMRDGEVTERFGCARCSWSIVPRLAASARPIGSGGGDGGGAARLLLLLPPPRTSRSTE